MAKKDKLVVEFYPHKQGSIEAVNLLRGMDLIKIESNDFNDNALAVLDKNYEKHESADIEADSMTIEVVVKHDKTDKTTRKALKLFHKTGIISVKKYPYSPKFEEKIKKARESQGGKILDLDDICMGKYYL